MSQSYSSTSTGLIEGAQAQDPAAWARLVHVYTPLIYAWCRNLGVSRDDMPDLVQDVFTSVAGSIGDFRGGPKGSFRAWLSTVTRRRVADRLRAASREPVGEGGTEAQQRLQNMAEPSADTEPLAGENDRVLAQQRLIAALRGEFEDRTWQAFWQTAVAGQRAAEVARELGMSVAAVYQAKSRVMHRFRQASAELEGD
jgi:RNA polymerase sigma-70 factor (ECF subfamily)